MAENGLRAFQWQWLLSLFINPIQMGLFTKMKLFAILVCQNLIIIESELQTLNITYKQNKLLIRNQLVLR